VFIQGSVAPKAALLSREDYDLWPEHIAV